MEEVVGWKRRIGRIGRISLNIHALITPWTRRLHAQPFDPSTSLRACGRLRAIYFSNQYSPYFFQSPINACRS